MEHIEKAIGKWQEHLTKLEAQLDDYKAYISHYQKRIEAVNDKIALYKRVLDDMQDAVTTQKAQDQKDLMETTPNFTPATIQFEFKDGRISEPVPVILEGDIPQAEGGVGEQTELFHGSNRVDDDWRSGASIREREAAIPDGRYVTPPFPPDQRPTHCQTQLPKDMPPRPDCQNNH